MSGGFLGGVVGSIETVLEELTNTTTVSDSVSKLLTYIESLFQGALNSPAQHEKIQEAVNTLKANHDNITAAVTANTSESDE